MKDVFDKAFEIKKILFYTCLSLSPCWIDKDKPVWFKIKVVKHHVEAPEWITIHFVFACMIFFTFSWVGKIK